MPTPTNAPASQRQQLTEVVGIPGYCTTRKGAEVAADTSPAWDGGSLVPETLSAPATRSNIVVTKLYRPAIHAPILSAWDGQVGRLRTTISVWDTDPDLGPIGKPRVYADALLVKLRWPEGDASSSDASDFELEFAVKAKA